MTLKAASQSKLCEIVDFFSSSKPLLRCFSHREPISCTSLAKLVLHLTVTDDETGNIRRRVAKDISGDVGGVSTAVDNVPEILAKYADVQLSEDDWSCICSGVVSRSACSARPSKRPRASSSSSRPSSLAIVPAEAGEEPSFQHRDAGDLQLVVLQHNEALARMQRDILNLQKNRDYYKGRCDMLAVRLHDEPQQNLDLVMRLNFRPGLRKVSSFGGYSLALRRALSHVGAGPENPCFGTLI